MDRIHQLNLVTKRLVIMTTAAVVVLGMMFGLTFFFNHQFMVTWVVPVCGIIGGFVSIQQRLSKLTDEELALLDASWFQVLLVPIFGGIFALVLYLLFLADIISGELFPAFDFPRPPTGADDEPVTGQAFMQRVFKETYPATGPDLAKLLFWSFVAGFSERFVPQLISKVTKSSTRTDPPEHRE
ncbi:hypothetical protein [Halomonas urumqiensis]|uniref:DUF4199 domain-containing protein n=1 Tax=Halomonas urumqiensis TaxID=1684789 RepID=A0A2N7UPD0_9GAMM|nr:hypothetical protein [Halomonas urumqiensis]PMR82288.1 hypothetical protein C1H70_03160 [Halomonas urumqiensis]PTB04249.1 hypothetical protein C6V82_00355 [Halomonas urumqiensis]GHE20855.1 hypothetical protein GCM10017767_13760 [Halomonas urumqiensis]